MLTCLLCSAVMAVNGDGTPSLCVEYEQEFVSPRRKCVGLLDALEHSEKSSEDAEEETDFPGEEKVMAKYFLIIKIAGSKAEWFWHRGNQLNPLSRKAHCNQHQ